MPKTAWLDFVNRHPDRHLVVARVGIPPSEDIGTTSLRLAQAGLSRLLGRLGLEGDYALSLVRAGGTPEIHMAFSALADADRLARTVEAKPVEGSDIWRSRRLFDLDDATRAAIEASLAMGGKLDEREPTRPDQRPPR